MTNKSSSMTMKSDNESKLVNTTSKVNNTNNIYYNCTSSSTNSSSSSNKLPIILTTTTTASLNTVAAAPIVTGGASSDLLVPSITLAPFAKIKREPSSTDQQHHHLHRLSSSSSMVTKSISNSSSSNNNNNICNNSQVPAVVNANSVSAKMGSRRIFTPQFKLQVLESYRNDSDCKGNQRATARKYNIHRRQIQKWLQCESNLRSSVANISANNVKHQFHNISHQMPIVTTSTLPSSSSSASSSIHTNNNNNNHHNHHQHHIHHNQQYKGINSRLSLDTSRHSVALASIPIQTSSKATQGVLAAAAAAAVAANVGDVGAVAPLSSPSSTVKSLHHAPTTSPILHHPQQILTKSTTVTPSAALQCSTKGGGGPVIGGPATAALTQLHSTYHSMGIHTPPALLTSVPVSVPIITPHPHTHLHLANLKSDYHQHHLHIEQHQQQQQQQQHHHHHHHIYNQVLQPLPPPVPMCERRSFMPSASLPVLPTSSSSASSSCSPSSSSAASTTASSPPAPMTAVALSCTDTLAATPAAVALSVPRALEENRIDDNDELRDYQATKTVVAENRYMNENEYAAVVHSRTQLQCAAFEGFHYYMPLHMHPVAAATTAMIAPIDLSLGTKRLDYALSSSSSSLSLFRENKNDENNRTFIEASSNLKHELSSPKANENDDDNDDSHLNVVDSDYTESSVVVDLTLRKRKVLMPTASEPETVSAEKHTKLSNEDHDNDDNDEKDHDKPVHEPAKTFKLFKPYLLGEDHKSNDETANKISKQKDPIIWSHHTACLSPPISHDSRQCSSRGSNFQSPSVDAYPFPAGSPTFQPTNATQVVSAASFRCPKGSPVSGYESSSSIYSDSTSSNNGDHPCNSVQHTTYSFDLKVHNVNGDIANKHLISTATGNRPFIGDNCISIPPTNINHVQRWLDQESGIRQSIALYV